MPVGACAAAMANPDAGDVWPEPFDSKADDTADPKLVDDEGKLVALLFAHRRTEDKFLRRRKLLAYVANGQREASGWCIYKMLKVNVKSARRGITTSM